MITTFDLLENVDAQVDCDDAQPLPEFSTAQGFGASSSISCYVPIYPGAQIWIEYSVDRPQPPEAIYLFKLFITGHFVTSWDVTSKNGFRGKVVYSLHSAKASNFAGSAVGQCLFLYSSQLMNGSPSTRDNCIEVRVHRVHARRRIRGLVDVPLPKASLSPPEAVKLFDAGYIDKCQRARRYQHLLIDAQDEPYAKFRFYCRTVDYLDRHGILDTRSNSSTSLATSASQYYDTDTSPQKGSPSTAERGQNPGDDQSSVNRSSPRDHTPLGMHSPGPRPSIPRSQSFGGSSIIRDSIEDLPSMVSRAVRVSPAYSPPEKRASLGSDQLFDVLPDKMPAHMSPTKASSPLLPPTAALRIRKRISHLPLTLNLAEHRTSQISDTTLFSNLGARGARTDEIPENVRSASAASSRLAARPLSPFTSGGFLRRLISYGDISPRKWSSEGVQAGKGWRGQRRNVSDPEFDGTAQRNPSRLGFLGRKSGV